MSDNGAMEEHKEVAREVGGDGSASDGVGNSVVLETHKPSSGPSSTAATATSSDAAKVRQLQSMMQQAREGYQALNQRYSTLQSDCRQLMKKEEESAATIQRLTAQVHRLSAAAAVAVSSASRLTETSGQEVEEDKSELDIDKVGAAVTWTSRHN